MLRAAGGANVDLAIVDGADHLVYTEDGNGQGPYDTIYRERILAFVATVVRRR
jgi:hypothetical protein